MALENQAATGEVEEVIDTANAEILTPEAPASIEDTIKNTLSAIRERGEAGEVGQPETPDTPEEKAQRIRDQQGKFAKQTPVDPVVPATPDQPLVPATPDPLATPPNTWKKEAHEAWAKADPILRAEAVRREADFHKGIEQYREAAGFGQAMHQAITPYAQTIQSLGITADKAVAGLMENDRVLRTGTPEQKAQKAMALLRDYGIDPTTLNAETYPPTDPTIAALQQQVQQLTGYFEQQKTSGVQQEEKALNSEISSFAADPKHSHFESVKGHMAALLQAGQASSLADAYEQAIYANPTTRALVLAQQQAEQRAETAKKAQAAKTAASVNTRSRPSMAVSEPIGTMDDTIRATLRKLQNA